MKDIDKLVEGIGLAIREAQTKVEEYSLEGYRKYFTEHTNKDGSLELRPNMVTLPLPNNNGGFEKVEVPIVALVNHRSLSIDEVKIALNLRTVWGVSEEDKVQVEVMSNLSDKNNEPGSNDSTNCKVEIVFKTYPDQEGVARVTTRLIQSI